MGVAPNATDCSRGFQWRLRSLAADGPRNRLLPEQGQATPYCTWNAPESLQDTHDY